MSLRNTPSDDDLLRQTLRSVAVLVGGCVLFVGVLSTTAVVVASKAVAPSAKTTTDTDDAKVATPTAKKPLSI